MAKEVDPQEIPEVLEYLQAQSELEAFEAQLGQHMEHLRALVSARNTKLQSADKAVRSRGVSCGPWQVFQTQTTYDAKALLDATSRETYLQVGGSFNTVQTLKLDKSRLKVAIDSGVLKQDVVDSVQTITPKYKAPKPVENL